MSQAAEACRPGANPNIVKYYYQRRDFNWQAELTPIGNCNDPDTCRYSVTFHDPEPQHADSQATTAEAPCGAKGAIGHEYNASAKYHPNKEFPVHGDAPGRDPDGVPRPSGSTRILATEAKQADATFNVYRSSAKSAAVIAKEYSATLSRAGFTIVRENSALMAAHDAERMLTISVRHDPRSHQTWIALACQPDHGPESTFKQNW